jgi:KDO2-lipid IV(A) lauroyltransferase
LSESAGPSRRDRAAAGAARALLGAIDRLGRERAFAAAGPIGRAYARLGGPRIADGRAHLRLAFPAWRESERRAVLERSVANIARSFVELCTLSSLTRADLLALADVEGFEHFEAAQRVLPGGGVIALTAHLGNWEFLAAVMAAHGIPITVVHRARGNPLFEQLVGGLRAVGGAELLPRGSAARGALKALRAGRVVAMPLDQNASRREGVFVPFFDRLACTRDGPARLAMKLGAPVLPVFIERIGDTMRHRVHAWRPLELVPEGADREAAVVENVARMTAVIEAAIRRTPDQWIWTHRRWKTRPKGAGSGAPHPVRPAGQDL